MFCNAIFLFLVFKNKLTVWSNADNIVGYI